MKVWNYTTGGRVYSSPAVVNGVVYVGSENNNVYALNATTGIKCGTTRPEAGYTPPPPS